jgi:uncharacterized protein
MQLEHRFTVPVPVDQAWDHFQDIASVAECFPGAQVTGQEGDTFSGSVKVKLGPIALVYNGSGTFTEKDESAHRFVVDAKGKDKRGNGTAGATVTLTMDGTGDSTDVNVHTDLAVTGKPAQFGRGVMQDVSDKLLGQFVACLEQRLGESGSASPAGHQDAGSTVEAAAADASAPPAASVPIPASEEPPAPPAAPAAPADEPTAADATAAAAASAPAAPPSAPAASTPPTTPPTTAGEGSSTRRSDDALDLGRTVLPVLARAYWKQALVALVVIVVVIWLIVR